MVMAPDMITFASQHLLFRVTHEFIPQFHPRAHYGQIFKILSNNYDVFFSQKSDLNEYLFFKIVHKVHIF